MFTEQTFGIITGTFAMSQFPSVPGHLVRFKANAGNTSPIWIGNMKNTGSFPFPYSIAAGYDTEWFELPLDDTSDVLGNLNSFWQNASSGTCYLAYWVMK